MVKLSGDIAEASGRKPLDEFLEAQLQHVEKVLAGREWPANTFSAPDTTGLVSPSPPPAAS
jgi:hypothetical protein